MSGKRFGARAAGLIFLIVGLTGACQDSDVLAPKDSTMTLTADKSQVEFEQVNPADKTVKLVARVLAAGGYPQQGVAVTFSATAGDLASLGVPVTTNYNSIAQDVLTLHPGAPASVEVTAASGDLSQKLTITTSSAGCTNAAPTANAGENVAKTEAKGTPFTVDLDGSGSQDFGSGNRDSLHYHWDCGNGSIAGSHPSHPDDFRYAQCTYTATVSPYTWTVTLTVTDNGVDPTCDPGTEVCVCRKSAVDTLTVTNTAPVTP